ncbi:hypothetical protein HMPREF9144_0636 [Prevotella pallens ATCC 700821]|uniref:Uncharacterized protein n=1 Tax=Prevotella pallens ATCC 700821 TaxID=997353 RepID=F9DG46_9BACT|nr:hypothetical protein HMPREF9144_0636 [Prevotella pallens ATCC 700821]
MNYNGGFYCKTGLNVSFTILLSKNFKNSSAIQNISVTLFSVIIAVFIGNSS